MAEKSELKLFGEIATRVAGLSTSGKSLLSSALEGGATVADLRLVEQVVERYGALTDTGREYVNKTLGVETETK